jgi:predicted component of type VI protein secretion system
MTVLFVLRLYNTRDTNELYDERMKQENDMQEQIQGLIKEYESRILALLNRKDDLKPTDPLYALIEIAVLNKQEFVYELRAIL